MTNQMTKAILYIGLITAAAYGCAAPSDHTVSERIANKTKETAEDIKSYTIEQKAEATTKAQAIIKDMDQRLTDVEKAIAEKKNEMSEATYKAKVNAIAKLKIKKEEVKNWYRKFASSTSEAWEEIKNGFVKSYEAFQDSYETTE